MSAATAAEPPAALPTILRRRDLATYFGRSEETISAWVEKGQLPRPTRRLGKSDVWTLDQIRGFLDVAQ